MLWPVRYTSLLTSNCLGLSIFYSRFVSRLPLPAICSSMFLTGGSLIRLVIIRRSYDLFYLFSLLYVSILVPHLDEIRFRFQNTTTIIFIRSHLIYIQISCPLYLLSTLSLYYICVYQIQFCRRFLKNHVFLRKNYWDRLHTKRQVLSS